MDSAPKDGQNILLCKPNAIRHNFIVGYYSEKHQQWIDRGGKSIYYVRCWCELNPPEEEEL